MSVESELGLNPHLGRVMVESWPGWAERRPVLLRVSDPCGLRGWLQDAAPELADEVVYGLSWLASVDGGDDRQAAEVLAWLLVPGAAFLARQLRTLTPDIDQVVAGQLWVLVRTFPLHRRKVIRNLMWDLRTEVLAFCEAPATVQRRDPAWYATTIGTAALTVLPAERPPTAWEELVDVLDWACDQEVIGTDDRRLLLLLVEASRDLTFRSTVTLSLLGNEATASVAAVLGVCDRTVRRRARRSIQALADAASGYTRVA